jgi:hypothetical protein
MNGIVHPVHYDKARSFIEQWHYSHNIPKGSHMLFGWFFDHELYAVADYGNGVNPHQAKYLSRITGCEVTNDNLVELKRLCRTEPRLEVQLTEFISRCHRLLRKTTSVRYVVSFSDPEYNHSGGIYKAANFRHLGKTQAELHVVDKQGNKRHRRLPYRYAKRNNCTIAEARLKLGFEVCKTKPKDRWFIAI